jgi:crotonobetainyl-CoA:carnitine CoA-transferase CaiB-like acyl-CoA transferase
VELIRTLAGPYNTIVRCDFGEEAIQDLLLENFCVDRLDRMMLGYEKLWARKRRLITCSLTGIGRTGPRNSRLGLGQQVSQPTAG